MKCISFRPQFKVHGFIELICNHFTCAAEIVNWICSRKFYQRDLVVKFKLDLTYKKDNECYRMDQIYILQNGLQLHLINHVLSFQKSIHIKPHILFDIGFMYFDENDLRRNIFGIHTLYFYDTLQYLNSLVRHEWRHDRDICIYLLETNISK